MTLDRDSKPTRRRFLRALGVSGAVGLAGCNSSSEESNTNSDGNQVDQWLKLPDPQAGGRPDNMQWNPWAKQAITYPVLFDRLIDWNPKSEEWEGYAVDYEYGNKRLTLTIKDGVKFHEGKSVTAKDVSVPFRIEMVLSPDTGFEKYVEDLSLNDEKTLEFTLKEDYDEDLIFGKLLSMSISTKWGQFKKHVEKLEAASSENEITKAETNLTEHQIDTPMATGPCTFDGARAQQVICPKAKGYRNADLFNFNGVQYTFIGSSQKYWGELTAGNIDIYDGRQVYITQEMANNAPDHVDIVKQPKHGGLSLIPNHSNEHLAKEDVRKAIAYALNRKNIAQNANSYTQRSAPSPTCSLSGPTIEKWIADVREKYTVYGPESKPEKAAEHMKKAGYKKNSKGMWIDSSGEKLTFPVNVSADMQLWKAAARTVAQQLQDFGLDTPLSASEHTSHWNSYSEGTWKGFSLGFWGHPSSPLPDQQLWLTLLRDPIPSPAAGNDPTSMKVPMPVGNTDGSQETLNVEKIINKMFTVSKTKPKKKLVKKASWAYNQNLPHVPLIQGIHPAAITRDKWKLPESDSPNLDNIILEKQLIPYHTLRNGLISAK